MRGILLALAAFVGLAFAGTASAHDWRYSNYGRYDYVPGGYVRHRDHYHYTPGYYEYQRAPRYFAPSYYRSYYAPDTYRFRGSYCD